MVPPTRLLLLLVVVLLVPGGVVEAVLPTLELEIDEIEGRIRSPVPTIYPSATSHEHSSSESRSSDSDNSGQHHSGQARALYLASQLARPSAGRRSAGA